MSHVMPASGVITQYFGCTNNIYEPAAYGCPHFHPGLDIANVTGTPIRASAAGTVVAANWNGIWNGVAWGFGGGNNVIIQHNNTPFFTIYAHMWYFTVSAGHHVNQGQIIGYMDTTGTATGPHVHWGAWYKSLWFTSGTPINPLRLIAGGDLANVAAYNAPATAQTGTFSVSVGPGTVSGFKIDRYTHAITSTKSNHWAKSSAAGTATSTLAGYYLVHDGYYAGYYLITGKSGPFSVTRI